MQAKNPKTKTMLIIGAIQAIFSDYDQKRKDTTTDGKVKQKGRKRAQNHTMYVMDQLAGGAEISRQTLGKMQRTAKDYKISSVIGFAIVYNIPFAKLAQLLDPIRCYLYQNSPTNLPASKQHEPPLTFTDLLALEQYQQFPRLIAYLTAHRQELEEAAKIE